MLPRDKAIEKIKYSIKKSYMRKGEEVVRKNFEAGGQHAWSTCAKSPPSAQATSTIELPPTPVSANAPEFVRDVTAMMMAGRATNCRSAPMPVDGTYPSATTQWEKRNISNFVPVWEPNVCIQCGNCAHGLPARVIRSKFYNETSLERPKAFRTAPIDARGFPDIRYTFKVYLEDCTGCGLVRRGLPGQEQGADRAQGHQHGAQGRCWRTKANIRFFETLPERWIAAGWTSPRCAVAVPAAVVRILRRLRRCGETPYVKLLSQLFGDRLLVANATGCSSIYGGNLPTTPWSVNSEGRGPAWSTRCSRTTPNLVWVSA